MEIENFSVIEEEFHERVRRIVWCTFATVDRMGRPRSRMMHPIWEGHQGWVATNRHSFKEKHLANNPYVSLTYWDVEQKQVYAECRAEWADDKETKERVWALYKDAPAPLGYDLSVIWSDQASDDYGVLSLNPWRIELSSIYDMASKKVWRQPDAS